jgi:fumarate reductase flavoprotein subunit
MSIRDACDLVIVGGGIAGLVAANRALELGLSVTLVERGEGDQYLCNSRMSGGVFHVAFHDVTAPAGDIRGAIEAATGGHADDELADALASDAGRAVAWLSEHGARFMNGGGFAWMSRVLTPPGLQRAGLHWKGRGGDALLRSLARRFADGGGTMHLGTRAVELLTDDGTVIGVRVERNGQNEELRGSLVLIADGGFQANADLVRRHITPDPDALCMRHAGTGRGDGLLMAEAAGAMLVNMDAFYGHVQCLEAIGSDALWPYPVLDHLTTAGVVVDATGARFADEGLGGIATANAIARLDAPATATVVFDEAIWNGPGRHRRIPPNPNAVDAGATLIAARSSDELADRLGMDRSVLGRTIAEHNNAVATGQFGALTPQRSNGGGTAMAIGSPLHAIRAAAGLTYTMGGIATDAEGRVRHRDGGLVPGLLAAGSAATGLEGGPNAGYVGGLTKAIVFALRSAEWAAGHART